MPLAESMLAILVAPELQTPLPVPQVNVSMIPTQSVDGPAIEPGDGFTVTTLVEKHPVAAAV
jgi:hypothetical protein